MSFTLNIFDMAEKYGVVKCQFAGIKIENRIQLPLFRVELEGDKVFTGTRFEIGKMFTEIMIEEINATAGVSTCHTEDNNAAAPIVSKSGSVQGTQNA